MQEVDLYCSRTIECAKGDKSIIHNFLYNTSYCSLIPVTHNVKAYSIPANTLIRLHIRTVCSDQPV